MQHRCIWLVSIDILFHDIILGFYCVLCYGASVFYILFNDTMLYLYSTCTLGFVLYMRESTFQKYITTRVWFIFSCATGSEEFSMLFEAGFSVLKTEWEVLESAVDFSVNEVVDIF